MYGFKHLVYFFTIKCRSGASRPNCITIATHDHPLNNSFVWPRVSFNCCLNSCYYSSSTERHRRDGSQNMTCGVCCQSWSNMTRTCWTSPSLFFQINLTWRVRHHHSAHTKFVMVLSINGLGRRDTYGNYLNTISIESRIKFRSDFFSDCEGFTNAFEALWYVFDKHLISQFIL